MKHIVEIYPLWLNPDKYCNKHLIQIRNKKHPHSFEWGCLDLKAGDDLLSLGKRHTTISAKRFHF